MTRHRVVALGLLLTALTAPAPGGASPGQGDIELNADQRRREVARIEVIDGPMHRVVAADQEIVAWLPQSFSQLRRAEDLLVYTEETDDSCSIGLAAYEVEPGLGLLHAWQSTRKYLSDDGVLQELISLRTLEVAGRPALEAVALTDIEEQEWSTRIMLSLDEDAPQLSEIILHCPRGQEEATDRLFKQILRDWTPIGSSVWSAGFEIFRARVLDRLSIGNDSPDGARESLVDLWSQRNRLFASIAKPEAIAQPWIGPRLQALGRGHPVLLIDGLLHHHPRVRSACLKALVGSCDDMQTRTEALALALRDPDPVVRHCSAQLIADGSASAASVLRRALGVDLELARSGVLQLLAVLTPETRRDLLAESFGERRQYPQRSQVMLATLLGTWGGDSADRMLLSAWRRSRKGELATTALAELLERGHPQAIEYAAHRLTEPNSDDLLTVSAALDGLIANAEPGADPTLLTNAADALATAAGQHPDDTPRDQARLEEWQQAAIDLNGLAEYLQGLHAETTRDEECAALRSLRNPGVKHDDGEHSDLHWARLRSAELSCTDPDPGPEIAPVLHIELSEPGSLILGLRDLLERLQLEAPAQNHFYRSLFESALDTVEESFIDPLSSISTGLDMSRPWRWWAWTASGADPSLLEPTPDPSVTLYCSDPERFLALLTRSTAESTPIQEMVEGGLAVSAALPLIPAAMVMIWEEQREFSLGIDSSPSREAVEEHLALFRDDFGNDGVLWRLRQLRLYRDDRPVFSTLMTALQRDDQVTLSPRLYGASLTPESRAADFDFAEPANDRGPAGHGDHELVLDIDLATSLRLAQDTVGPWSEDDHPSKVLTQQLIDSDLGLHADFNFDGSSLATSYALSGVPSEWVDALQSLPIAGLRAPGVVLPADTLIWSGVGINQEHLTAVLMSILELSTNELDHEETDQILRLLPHLGPECGIGVIGMPSPTDDEWSHHVLVYIEAESTAAREFLDQTMKLSDRIDGARLYQDDRENSPSWMLIDGFLAASANQQLLREIANGPRLSSTKFYEQIATRSPVTVAAVAGLNADLFADALLALPTIDADDGLSRFATEFLRAFGPIVAWSTIEGSEITGQIELRPNLLTEKTRARARRLVGYTGYTAGSIPVDGFSTGISRTNIERIELELILGGDGWPLAPQDLRGNRIELRQATPRRAHVVSRSAARLPVKSSVRLPISDPELTPYLRSESGYGLRRKEIRELADEIRGDETDPAQIVRAVLAWVETNLEYKSVRGSENTEEILASRQADCTEFSHLTIALCRSLGIPARGVSGAVVDAEMAILHRWVEVYLDRWYEIDPTSGDTHVPAWSLRLPLAQGHTLASFPGCQLRLQSAHGADGGLARRLLPVQGRKDEGRVEIAVDDDQLVIAVNEPAPPGGASMQRFLVSCDRGEHFREIPDPLSDGRNDPNMEHFPFPDRLIAGHGHSLWLTHDGDGRSRLFEFSGKGASKDLSDRLDKQLTRGLGQRHTRWTMAPTDDGFLLITGDNRRSAALLDKHLRFDREIEAPTDMDETWILGRSGPLLVHRTTDGGLSLIEQIDDGWSKLVDFNDSQGLEPLEIRTEGERTLVICRDPQRERQTILWWSRDSGRQNRKTPEHGAPVRDSLKMDSWTWTVWRDGHDLLFSRHR